MDYQNRVGGKTGSGGVASASESNRDRRERLRQLALETIDLQKDPYFMRNHLGSYECKLCLTLHNNEGSYLAHTQGKKHQSNLARRAAKDAKDNNSLMPQLISKSRIDVKKFVKIGRPGYRITKQLDPANNQQSLLFQIDYPEIADNIMPRHRFMSAYEQKIEPPDRHWQYVLFAAEPYETIAFKVPSREVDKSEGKFWTLWNKDSKQFFLQFAFRVENSSSSMQSGFNLNANNQNFISHNNLLNRVVDKNTIEEEQSNEDGPNDEIMNDQMNEFNNQINERLNDQNDNQDNQDNQFETNEQDYNDGQNYDNDENGNQNYENNNVNYEDDNSNYDQQDDGQNYEEENDENYDLENNENNVPENV